MTPAISFLFVLRPPSTSYFTPAFSLDFIFGPARNAPEMSTPEELARQQIDALLQQRGWAIEDHMKLDLSAGRGIAIREVRLEEGCCDYLSLIVRICRVEAITSLEQSAAALKLWIYDFRAAV